MSITDDRIIPLARVRVFDKGEGDNLLTDHGFRWYDLAQSSFTPTRSSAHAVTQQRHLETIEGIGVVLKAYLVQQPIRNSHITAEIGTVGPGQQIQEQSTTFFREQGYYMVFTPHVVGTPEIVFRTNYSLPEDPQIGLSLAFSGYGFANSFGFPVPDPEVTFPYARLELGGGTWGLQASTEEGLSLVRNVDGVWVPVMDINTSVSGSGLAGTFGIPVILRVLRGKIAISTDIGRTYQIYEDPTGAPITIPAGPIRARTFYGLATFRLYRVHHFTGTYTSPDRPTFHSRPAGLPTFAARTDEPGATSITFSDNSSATAASYTATLTPEFHATGYGWSVPRTPVLMATRLKYPVAAVAASKAYSEPFESRILSIDIEKPIEIDLARATINLLWDTATLFEDPGHWRWRKLQIDLGYAEADGTEHFETVFTGYVRRIVPRQDEFGKPIIGVECDGVTEIAKEQEWSELTAAPLGGQTGNEALLDCLNALGLDAVDAEFHEWGDLIVLPAGLPEAPFLWPKPGESIWGTMVQISDFLGLEIAGTDAGLFRWVPKDFVEPLVSHAWNAVPVSSIKERIEGVALEFDSSLSLTAVIIRGEDAQGNPIWAFVNDLGAETDKTLRRFSPWRSCYSEHVEGTLDQALITRLAETRYVELAPLKLEPNVEAEVMPEIGRRYRVRLLGVEHLGVSDADEFVVLTLHHHYEAVDFTACKTVAGIRQLVDVLETSLEL